MYSLLRIAVFLLAVFSPLAAAASPVATGQKAPPERKAQDFFLSDTNALRVLLQRGERMYRQFSSLSVLTQCVGKSISPEISATTGIFSFYSIAVTRNNDGIYFVAPGNLSLCEKDKGFRIWFHRGGMFAAATAPATFVGSHPTKPFSLLKLPQLPPGQTQDKIGVPESGTVVATLYTKDFSNTAVEKDAVVYTITTATAQPGLIEFVRDGMFIINGFSPDPMNKGMLVANAEGELVGLVIRHLFPDGRLPRAVVVQILQDDFALLIRMDAYSHRRKEAFP